jgi:hypothetical protein
VICGGSKAVSKQSANKGPWSPKIINLQHLHNLQGLTATDIKFILRKVLLCEYTLDQLASVTKGTQGSLQSCTGGVRDC